MTVINPKRIVQEGILQNVGPESVQQNGIDLRLNTVEKLQEEERNVLTNADRSHCKRWNVLCDEDTKFTLYPGIYDITFMEEIEIPNGMCAQILTRSTVNRGGNFITAGLYDAGYKGVLGAILHVHVPITLELGVRLAQIVFSEAEEGDLYTGIYNEKKAC